MSEPTPYRQAMFEFFAQNYNLILTSSEMDDIEHFMLTQTRTDKTLQDQVRPWVITCFDDQVANNKSERNHRFLEESLELVQSIGCTKDEAHQLVDYVFNRPIGEPEQEVGGVMITLTALCLANGLDMHKAGDKELIRIWCKIDKIRAKQATKPKHSPLPGTAA